MSTFTLTAGDGYKIVDLSGLKKVLDVDGGDGSLLIELFRWNPHISDAVHDLEEITSKTNKKFVDHDLQGKFGVIQEAFLIVSLKDLPHSYEANFA
mmetsp:Transcript_1017/g.1014  ORF Transcript_1017/g.1014 Transcript_1017/m.1014 type:complete len:96 (+) Transcript_1017:355-642(+)